MDWFDPARMANPAQPVWFPVQQPALETGMPVWSWQKDNKRRTFSYVSASFDSFWTMFNTKKKAYFCEIIRTGQPCHIYVDVEQEPRDGCWDGLYALLKRELMGFLDDLYPGYAKRMVLMDASNENKASKHVIVKIDGAMMENNEHAGNVLLHLLQRNPQLEKIVDMVVYSRNRPMRTLGSDKRGKNRPLRFEDGHKPSRSDFFDSLITYFPEEPPDLLTCASPVVPVVKRVHAAPRNAPDVDVPPEAARVVSALVEKLGVHPTKVIYRPKTHTAGVWTTSHECEIKGSAHSSNHVWYEVSLADGTYRQRCFSSQCSHRTGAWHALVDAPASRTLAEMFAGI